MTAYLWIDRSEDIRKVCRVSSDPSKVAINIVKWRVPPLTLLVISLDLIAYINFRVFATLLRETVL